MVYVEANASIQQYESPEGKRLSSINLVQREFVSSSTHGHKTDILIESINKLAGARAEKIEEE